MRVASEDWEPAISIAIRMALMARKNKHVGITCQHVVFVIVNKCCSLLT